MSAPEILPLAFDYGILPAEIRSEAMAAADEIKKRMRGAIIEVGAALSRMKDRLPHGQFGTWLSAEFGFTERTAQNYMAAAALAAKYETVSYLRPKTLYRLAAPTTPEAVRQTLIGRFNAGEKVADHAVKELIDEAKWQEKKQNWGRKAHGRKPNQRPPKPQTRALHERQAARPLSKSGAAFYAQSGTALAPQLPPSPPRGADADQARLVQLLEVLQGNPKRIADLPKETRVAHARTSLRFLDIRLEDLRWPPGREREP